MAETPQQRATAILTAAALACVAGALGCYRPNILDGGFLCAESGKTCPDNYVCDRSTNTCRRQGSIVDAALDLPLDMPVDRMTDAKADTAEVACIMPVPNCTAQDAGVCDPVCQRGCGCQEKCSTSMTGALGCHVPLAGNRGAYASCDMSVNQTDNCAPGLVCIADHCANHCYAFCRVDGDCPGSTCTGDAGGGVKICAVKFTTCDPVGAAAKTSCGTDAGATAVGCYVSSTMPDKTVCDCPAAAGGVGVTCSTNLDCVPGLVCVDALGNNDLRCRQLCTVGSTCASCTTARFNALGGSTLYGYCY